MAAMEIGAGQFEEAYHELLKSLKIGFAVSTGAACASGALVPSHVLTAIGLSEAAARGSMRFSLGRSNTADQVEALVGALEECVQRLRKVSAHA